MVWLDQIADACRLAPRRAKWVVVPAHALGHTLGDRLALHGTPWANVRFRTLADLALETAGPTIAAAGLTPVPTELGPPLAMRLLRDLPVDTPPYFRPLATERRMAGALWRSLRDLRLAGFVAATLDKAAFDQPAKAAELRALLEAYERWLAAARVVDEADLLRAAATAAATGPVRPADLLFVWPDRVWAPLERAFLAALPAERVRSRVPELPGVGRPRRMPAADVDVVILDPAACGPLGALSAPDRHVARGPADVEIDLFRAGGREAEVDEACRRIAAHGASLDAVEIVCASPGYHTLVWERAVGLGWPVTVAQGVPAATTRSGRALLAWCQWVEDGVAASGLRRMLSLGWLRYEGPDGSGPGAAARLLARSDATWGRATYRPALARLAAGERARAEDADLDEARRALALAAAARADHLAGWIAGLLALVPDGGPEAGEVDIATLARGAERLLDKYVPVPDEARAAWDEQARFDRLAALAIREELSGLAVLEGDRAPLSDALVFVREAIETLAVGSDRARPGKLHITSLASAGLAGRSTTFVVGVEEGRLFPALIEDPVLLDADRARLSADLETSHDRASEAVHVAVARLSALAGHVTLSHSCRDLREARPAFPSWVLLQAVRLRARDSSLSYDALGAHLGTPVTQVPASRALALDDTGWWLAALRHEGVGQPAARALAEQAFPGLAAGRRARLERESDTFSAFDGWVPAAGAALDPRQTGRPFSPTRLEAFAACPYRFFLEQGLGVVEFEEEERQLDRWLDPLTRGALMHRLYATTLRALRARGERADLARDRGWLHELAEAELAELGEIVPPPSPQVFDRERDELLADLDLFLAAESTDRDRVPVALEVGFGLPDEGADEALGSATPVELELRGRRQVKLRGRIDRIDRLATGGYEVIDYKTGFFRRSDWTGTFRGGRMLQHALYGLAAKQLLTNEDPDARIVQGTYYFTTRRGRRQRVAVPAPPPARVAELLDDLFDVAAAGGFVHTPDEHDCRYCSFETACLKDHDRAARKLAANPALGPFLRVRGHE